MSAAPKKVRVKKPTPLQVAQAKIVQLQDQYQRCDVERRENREQFCEERNKANDLEKKLGISYGQTEFHRHLLTVQRDAMIEYLLAISSNSTSTNTKRLEELQARMSRPSAMMGAGQCFSAREAAMHPDLRPGGCG